MPVELHPTAELDQCPEHIRVFVGKIIQEVRGTTRGRRNTNLELAAMRAIAQKTSLDPTAQQNAKKLTAVRINGIREQIAAAVRTSYKRKISAQPKPTPGSDPASANPATEPSTPTPDPTPTSEPTTKPHSQEPPAIAPAEPAQTPPPAPPPTPATEPIPIPTPAPEPPLSPKEQEIFTILSPLEIVTDPELIALIKEATKKMEKVLGEEDVNSKINIRSSRKRS